MKKTGKYVKQAVKPAVEKKPNVKSALLQTYFTSLLCLVLCVSMFLGTSYAWFTSEVTNTDNEIYVGTLAVGLYKEVADADDDGKPDYVSLSAVTEGKNAYHLFDSGIRWEPGYTALETIRVTNEGDLAFKYVLSFTDGALAEGDADALAKVAENFEVWVFNHHEKDYENPDSYEAMKKNSGWVCVGTLAEVLKDKNVLENVMVTVRQDDQPNDATTPNGTNDGVKTIDTYTIALHMKEGANDENLMGQKISLSVKLVAYQMPSEEDDFNNSEYDKACFVYTKEELQEALDKATNNTVIVFGDDITGDVIVTQKEGVNITIDGNGKTLAGVILVDGKSATYTTAGLTIRNVNFEADSISADACIRLGDGTNNTRYTCNVTVRDCIFNVPGAVGVKSYTGGDKNLIITGCTANANAHSLVQAKGIDGVLVENCKVYSKNGMNFNNSDNVTVSGCTADVKGYAVRFGESSGGVGAAETYLIKNCTLKSACDDGDAVIVLRGTADYATLTIESTTITGNIEITNTATDATVVK